MELPVGLFYNFYVLKESLHLYYTTVFYMETGFLDKRIYYALHNDIQSKVTWLRH